MMVWVEKNLWKVLAFALAISYILILTHKEYRETVAHNVNIWQWCSIHRDDFYPDSKLGLNVEGESMCISLSAGGFINSKILLPWSVFQTSPEFGPGFF